ncbi:LexA family transcriptional regulator [Microvirga sesbaniae]|uniref:LexA family transcriptional regulator n=1 Tax=Microvirga sesbaniae TaxID=681392 RepID=UPI0021C86E55|nr:XRE family transcriptional regulator [Microvirga sp. HBU67692]
MERHERLAWARATLSAYPSASEAARAMGMAVPTYAGHENGSRGITSDAARRYADFYKVSAEWLLYGRGEPRAGIPGPDRAEDRAPVRGRAEPLPPDTDLSKAEDLPHFKGFGGPRNVPAYGTAVGGGDRDGDFRFNGQTIGYEPRPPGIQGRKDVYVLYVQNDSMDPKYEPGERLYVDPHRPPRPMDYVVVELQGDDGEPGKGFIKRLVRQTPTKVIVEQFNPRKEIEFDRQEIKSLHRVIPTDELLGI